MSAEKNRIHHLEMHVDKISKLWCSNLVAHLDANVSPWGLDFPKKMDRSILGVKRIDRIRNDTLHSEMGTKMA